MGSNVTVNIPEKQKVTADFTEKDNFSGRNVIQIILGLAILFGMLITTDLEFTYHIAPSFSTLDTFSQKIGFYEGNFTASAAVYLTKYILQAIIIIISCIFLFVISKASTKNRRKAPLAYMIIITVPIMIANLMPFILNAIISLKQRVPGGFLSGEFIGIDNYKMIFSAKPFQSSVLHTLILAVLLTLSVGILSFLLYHSMKYINNRAVITIYCMLSIIPICISKYNFSNLLMSNRTVNNSVTYFLFELIQLTGIALCILGYANLKRNREIVTTDAPIKRVLAYILPSIYSLIPIYMMARLFIYLFGKYNLGTEVTDQIPLFLLLSILAIISSFISMIL
jgi:hypothetical protein